MRARMRTYTASSIGVGIVWAVLLVLASSARRGAEAAPWPARAIRSLPAGSGQFFGSSQSRPAAATRMIHARIAERRRARGTSRQPGPA